MKEIRTAAKRTEIAEKRTSRKIETVISMPKTAIAENRKIKNLRESCPAGACPQARGCN